MRFDECFRSERPRRDRLSAKARHPAEDRNSDARHDKAKESRQTGSLLRDRQDVSRLLERLDDNSAQRRLFEVCAHNETSLESSSTVTALLVASACWEGISAINRWQATGR